MSVSRADFVAAVIQQLAPPDLAARYSPGMETQVIVRPGNGEQVFRDGRPTPLYSNAGETWYSYRIDSAESAAKTQTFDLTQHYDSIGMSGHDPVRGVSFGVGFDFDALVGHKAGLTNEELEKLLAAFKKLPYVEVRKSTSGSGYHIWTWFNPTNLPLTRNRAEHKALARAVLQKMSQDAGHDFEADIDCYGGMLWICARRATAENGGLSLVRAAEATLDDYPSNWHEHLDVVTGARRRTKVHANIPDDEAAEIDQAYQDAPRGLLDDEHRRFIEMHNELGYQTSWSHDLGCLTGHSHAIKLIQQQFGLKGVFETLSEGTDPSNPNCYMFPGLNGSWRVYRFGKDTKEAGTWGKSANGWTTCTINEPATLAAAATAYGGVPSPQKTAEAYLFRDAAAVRSVLGALCGQVEIPDFLADRQLCVRSVDDGSVVVEADYREGDDVHADDAWSLGWVKDKRKWGAVVAVETQDGGQKQLPDTDSMVRHLAQHGKQVSLFANTAEGWQQQQTDRVRDYLKHRGVEPKVVPYVLGWAAAHPWELVAIPFADEFPGRRRWNRDGAKLLYAPADQPGPMPHWDLIMDHIGRGLDDAVESDAWCAAHGIACGADYVRFWIAVMLRTPRRRLPLLFMYSHPEQNTGKSILHEGVSQLFDENGFTFADKALTLSSGFNAELRGKALCVVEESNIAKSESVYTRLKAWVTGPTIQITPKGKDSFTEENYTHWVMTSNNQDFLPIEPGDTRVVMWEVTPFEREEIPKDELLRLLRKEAPQFLHHLFNLDITDSAGRHTLPVITTAEKDERMRQVEAVTKFGGLSETPRMLCEAIISMPKPFSGTATALDRALGDWCPEVSGKSSKSRTTMLGRHLKRIEPALNKQGIMLTIETGRMSTYHIAV